MKYTFHIVGISSLLDFFSHQQHQKKPHPGVEYVVAHKCTLDAVIKSVEPVPLKLDWNMDEVVDTVINFWLNNSDSVSYWKSRLTDAGRDNLLVTRVAEIKALKMELDSLFGEN